MPHATRASAATASLSSNGGGCIDCTGSTTNPVCIPVFRILCADPGPHLAVGFFIFPIRCTLILLVSAILCTLVLLVSAHARPSGLRGRLASGRTLFALQLSWSGAPLPCATKAAVAAAFVAAFSLAASANVASAFGFSRCTAPSSWLGFGGLFASLVPTMPPIVVFSTTAHALSFMFAAAAWWNPRTAIFWKVPISTIIPFHHMVGSARTH
jgi:hypothetical protein